jgi:Flp pilus assembly protein TadD
MEAVALLERNLHRFPSWAEARLNLGIAYIGTGNLPAARRELATLQRLDPRMASRLADQIRRAGANPPQ